MRRLLESFELLLTGVGVVVVALFYYFFRDSVSPWRITAIAAVVIAVIHGILFYEVRSTQRRIRRHAVATIRDQLRDLAEDRLEYVLSAAEVDSYHWKDAARQAVTEIYFSLDQIETEPLTRAPRFRPARLPRQLSQDR